MKNFALLFTAPEDLDMNTPLGSACGCAVIFSSMLLHFTVFASPAPPGKQSLFTKNTLTKKPVSTPQKLHQIKCICIITPLGDGGKKAPPIFERCLYYLLLFTLKPVFVFNVKP